MDQTLEAVRRAPWFSHAGRLIATVASTGAGIVSIASALYSFGIIGSGESRLANHGATWIGMRPKADTASAIGDTLHLAATVTNKSGSVLVNARPTWLSDDSLIAEARQDGSVIARRAGATTITASIGGLSARAHVVVRQRVATMGIASASPDSFVVAEGARLPLRARAFDAHGHIIVGADDRAQWLSADSAIGLVDSSGVVTGRSAGHTRISATIDGISASTTVTVLAIPWAIAAVAGIGQHALAGAPLPQRVVVRVSNRKGQAMEGQLVTFRVVEAQGSVEPTAERTDADGRARASWTLGDLPGRQSLLATVPQLDSALTIVAEAEPVAADTRISALVDSASARAGRQLPEPVGVRLADTTGRALADVPVSWAVLDGGSVEALDARTDSLGQAHARWKLGARVGTQRLRVQVGAARSGRSVAPLMLRATALAGAPAKLSFVATTTSRATVSGRGKRSAGATKRLIGVVTDDHGNPVANTAVFFAAKSGSVVPASAATDARGRVAVTWTVGGTSANQRLVGIVRGTDVTGTYPSAGGSGKR